MTAPRYGHRRTGIGSLDLQLGLAALSKGPVTGVTVVDDDIGMQPFQNTKLKSRLLQTWM